MASLPFGETADAFIAQAAQDAIVRRDSRYTARLVVGIAGVAARDSAVSRATASKVLNAIDRLSGIEGFEELAEYRGPVARAAGGG
jgi:hypothetical protein